MLKNLSSESGNIVTITSHKVVLISDDVAVDDGRSIPSSFPQQTVKQVEIIQEVVLSEVSKLNHFSTLGVMNKK